MHDAGMWPQATVLYERATRLAPDEPNLLTDLGICYQNQKMFDKALAEFERAQKADPSHWQSLYNTVIVAGFDLRRYDDAREGARKLEKIHPQAPNLPAAQGSPRQGGRARDPPHLWLVPPAPRVALSSGGSWRAPARERHGAIDRAARRGRMVRDRVCETFVPRSRALLLLRDGQEHFFCSEGCRTRFLGGGQARPPDPPTSPEIAPPRAGTYISARRP